ncbi:hypothetical protein OAM15_04650 [Pelagibacteraceae bacterium]|jgi:hypothetical protein|nr:hypothetical protein [Pelagibacteraceae bacterium]|tara:strand:+ start:2585 stop:3139 length:555 start_codon:yes stop_codon:yes gene_type:complete
MPKYSLYALLWVDKDSEKEISDVLKYKCGVGEEHIQRRMHLTIYHSRRRLIEIKRSKTYETIKVDVKETRFMVLSPGGENPKKNIDPNNNPVGIRLTKRNIAIPRLVQLRRSLYKNENENVLKNRRHRTTDWKNAFGSNHFQAHILMIRPGNRIDKKLTNIGKIFRQELKYIYFNKFEIKDRKQ